MKQVVLASASPRRRVLLNQIGIDCLVHPANIVESKLWSKPEAAVIENAVQKAQAVRKAVADAVIIGADTMVVLDDNILGKPKSKREAIDMLSSLSGKMHIVLTGLALLDSKTGELWTECEKTRVYFKSLSQLEIVSYVTSGASMDKAGAYGIQDRGALFVERIDGCYYNVVGLPLVALARGLESLSVSIWENSHC
jgi:septum formation protein